MAARTWIELDIKGARTGSLNPALRGFGLTYEVNML